MARDLTFNITTKDEQTVAALKRIQRELGQTGTAAEVTGKKAKAGLDIKGALAGVAVLGGAKFALGEAEQAQQTAARTAQVIKTTGNAAQVSAKQQDEYVQALSKTAAIDDEVIAGGANLLRTFTNIKGQAFQPALEAAVNLSAAMGTDLQSSIVQVGKALNDPVKGVTALQRVGVSFTAQQKDQIKTMVEVGDTAGAQKLILGELSKEFGGDAKAMATDSARAKVAIGNAAEEMGGALAPAVKKGADAIGFASDAFGHLSPQVQTATLALGAAAVVGPKVVTGLKGLKDSAVVAKEFAQGMTAAKAGTIALGAGAAAVAAGGLYAVNIAMQTEADSAARAQEMVERLRTSLESGSSTSETVSKEVAERWAKGADDLEAVGIKSASAFRDLAMMSDAQFEKWKSTQGGFFDKNSALPAVTGLRNALSSARHEFEASKSAQKDLGVTIDETGEITSKTGGQIASLTDKLKLHAAAIDGVNKATQDGIAAGFDEFSANQSYQESVAGVTQAEAELKLIRKAGDREKIAAAEGKLNDAIEHQVEAKGKQATATEKANGRDLSAIQLAQIQKAELEKLTAATGFQSDALNLLVIRLTQTRDRADEATTSLRNLESAARGREERGGAPAPGTPGSAIPGTRNPDKKSAAVIVHGDLNVGGVHGVRDLKMTLNQHAAQQDAKTARQVMTQ